MKPDRFRNALDSGYEDVAAGCVIQLECDAAIDSLSTELWRSSVPEVAGEGTEQTSKYLEALHET